jgi:hypothetical protein
MFKWPDRLFNIAGVTDLEAERDLPTGRGIVASHLSNALNRRTMVEIKRNPQKGKGDPSYYLYSPQPLVQSWKAPEAMVLETAEKRGTHRKPFKPNLQLSTKSQTETILIDDDEEESEDAQEQIEDDEESDVY